MNRFILFQKEKGKGPIYIVSGNDIHAVASVIQSGAVEVGRLNTTLDHDQFVSCMAQSDPMAGQKIAAMSAIRGIIKTLRKEGII